METSPMKAGKIFSRISEIMVAVGPVTKDRRNTSQGYQYRGIDDMYNVLNEHLATAKVFVTGEMISEKTTDRLSKAGGAIKDTEIWMKYYFWTDDGSYVCTTTKGESMDSGDKGAGKAMSTAYKYALMQVFCIPTEDIKDVEHDTPEIAKPVVKPTAKPVKKTEEQKKVDGFSVMTDVTKNSILTKLKELGKDYDRTPFTKRGITTMESFKAFAKDTGELLTEQEGLDILKEYYTT